MRASRVIIILAIIVFGGVEGGAKCCECLASAIDSTAVIELGFNGLGNGIVADSLAVDSSYSGRWLKVMPEGSDLLPKFPKNSELKPSIYELPYSLWTHRPNYRKVVYNSVALYAAGVAMLGILEMLPEDATAWNKEEIRSTPFFERWWNHVKKGPVWDHDKWYFNYLLHPYGGAAYYMSARSQGFSAPYAMLYGFGVSTLFWEYGIEAFNEIPSIQDLIITPLAGAVIGEAFYVLKRSIVAGGYRLFGSKVLGNIVAYLIDPVNEVMGLIYGNDARRISTSFALMPGKAPGIKLQASLSIVF